MVTCDDQLDELAVKDDPSGVPSSAEFPSCDSPQPQESAADDPPPEPAIPAVAIALPPPPSPFKCPPESGVVQSASRPQTNRFVTAIRFFATTAGISLVFSLVLHATIIVSVWWWVRHQISPPTFEQRNGDGVTGGFRASNVNEDSGAEAGLVHLPVVSAPATESQSQSTASAMQPLTDPGPQLFEKSAPPSIEPPAEQTEQSMFGVQTAPLSTMPQRPAARSANQGSATGDSASTAAASSAEADLATTASASTTGTSHAWTDPRVAGIVGNPGRNGAPGGIDDRGMPIPEYPLESTRRGEEGIVKLDVEILPDGTVGRITVLEDAGFPRLVRAAATAVQRVRFTPATLDGAAVQAHFTVPFQFILKKRR